MESGVASPGLQSEEKRQDHDVGIFRTFGGLDNRGLRRVTFVPNAQDVHPGAECPFKPVHRGADARRVADVGELNQRDLLLGTKRQGVGRFQQRDGPVGYSLSDVGAARPVEEEIEVVFVGNGLTE